jgi:hypothetical protein
MSASRIRLASGRRVPASTHGFQCRLNLQQRRFSHYQLPYIEDALPDARFALTDSGERRAPKVGATEPVVPLRPGRLEAGQRADRDGRGDFVHHNTAAQLRNSVRIDKYVRFVSDSKL